MSSFTFGQFDYFCSQTSLAICPALKLTEPVCYARNVDFSTTLLFQPATLVVHVAALIMTTIMIFNIRSKYTAVGRKEIVMFFYMFLLDTILEFLLISNIIPAALPIYNFFAAAHVACICTTFWILLLNGFVGFQWAEDGTPRSLWGFRITGAIIFVISFIITIGTTNSMFGLSPSSTTPLFILYFVFNGIIFLVYSFMQLVLILNTLEDRWPLGDISFGILFFVVAQVFLFAISNTICDQALHYVDGMFFGTIFNLLSVMMVYKYWDSITKEDLEFSVGGAPHAWDLKEPLMPNEGLPAQNVELEYMAPAAMKGAGAIQVGDYAMRRQ